MLHGRRTTTSPGPGRCLAAAVCLLPFALTGCANFWDEVTSRDFSVRTMFAKTEPVEVLRTSSDGDKRAKALAVLKEPKRAGGTDQQQDEAMEFLSKAAVNDREPWCRLAAIETLGRFEDARAVQVLVAAYDQAANVREPRGSLQQAAYFPPTGAFPPETVGAIRCQALLALGQTHNPAAVERLTKVVRQPPVEGAELERQLSTDERIAAARALGNFNQPQAVEALVRVMQTEKDVALRNRARESLEAATGRKIAPDFKDWDQLLGQARTAEPAAPEAPRKERLFKLF